MRSDDTGAFTSVCAFSVRGGKHSRRLVAMIHVIILAAVLVIAAALVVFVRWLKTELARMQLAILSSDDIISLIRAHNIAPRDHHNADAELSFRSAFGDDGDDGDDADDADDAYDADDGVDDDDGAADAAAGDNDADEPTFVYGEHPGVHAVENVDDADVVIELKSNGSAPASPALDPAQRETMPLVESASLKREENEEDESGGAALHDDAGDDATLPALAQVTSTAVASPKVPARARARRRATAALSS